MSDSWVDRQMSYFLTVISLVQQLKIRKKLSSSLDANQITFVQETLLYDSCKRESSSR